MKKNGFTVIMPTYNQCGFIRRSIVSLMNQTYKEWELIIINDGCTDETEVYLSEYLTHPKIRYIKNDSNMGLGFALNLGLMYAKYEWIAYLPSDDFYYENHLKVISEQFVNYPNVILVVNGVKYNNSDSQYSYPDEENIHAVPNHCLQLVQCCHLLTDDHWMERDEFVTDNLFTMFWGKLAKKGVFIFSGVITCQWTNHTEQRHKIISEYKGGNIHYYKKYYGVQKPIIIKVATIKVIDENKLYTNFRKRQSKTKKMKVLIVGELSYNAERICSLEEHGCELFGLWIQKPYSYTSVGPFPFGNVKTIPYEGWQTIVKKVKPDIIYALLNTIAIPIAHEVLKNKGDIPMVWHLRRALLTV